MSVLASHLAHASSTKEKQWRCRFGRAQALRGAESQSQNIKISLRQQETTWSLTQSARANFSTDISALFLLSPSLGFIPVVQTRQGREHAACTGAELFCSRWVALWHPRSGTSVLGSPLLKMGMKAWSSAPVSGEQPNLEHPVGFQITFKSTQREMTSPSPPSFPPTLPRVGMRNIN